MKACLAFSLLSVISLGLVKKLALKLPTLPVEHWWFSVPSSELSAFPLIYGALIFLTILNISWMYLTCKLMSLVVCAGLTGWGYPG